MTLKDIQNIQAQAKRSQQNGHRDAQILLDKMAESLNKASGGVVIDNKENLYVLYYQSGFMAQLFKKFPEK